MTLPKPAVQACAALWEAITGKPLGKERPLQGSVTPARPQGSCDTPPHTTVPPSNGSFQVETSRSEVDPQHVLAGEWPLAG